jgi:hypothetical protein
VIRARRLAALLLLVTVCTGAPRVSADDPLAAPALVAPEATWDAGRVDVGTRVTHTYELRNQGPRLLTLTVKTTCGCTTTDFDQRIPAGGTGKVTAVLDTTHVRGRVVKTIRVTTDDASQPAVPLTLIAEVMHALDVLPTDQPVLRAPVSALQPMELTVAAPDGAPFAIVRVEEDPLLAVTVRPDAAGTPPAGEHRRHRLTLTPKRDLAVGTYTPTVTLVTTRPKAERFELRPTILVTGPIATMPTQLELRAAAAPMSVRVFTESAGVSFHVLTAEATDPDFHADVVTVEDGRTYDITVRYAGPAERQGRMNAALKVTTDEPRQRLVLIRFSGNL